MNSIRDNVGFITGFGAGVVACYIIGKAVYGFPITTRESEESDIESDDSSLWEDEDEVNSDEVEEVLNELGVNSENLDTKNNLSQNKPRKTKRIGDCKMVLVVRNDLKMGKGKAAAQCSHAAVGAFKNAKKGNVNVLRAWERNGQPKIVTKVDNEEELLKIYQTGRSLNLVCSIIQDAGRTQIAPGSKTVVAILGEEEEVDKVTNTLKLY